MGCRSLEWNWPKEAISTPIWAVIVAGAKNNLDVLNSQLINMSHLVPFFYHGRYGFSFLNAFDDDDDDDGDDDGDGDEEEEEEGC